MAWRAGRTTAVAVAVALATAGSMTACTRNSGQSDNGQPKNTQLSVQISTDAKDSTGPAKPVSGAVRGGNLVMLQSKDFEHLDPQATYTPTAQAMSQMVNRTLNTFVTDPATNKTKIVGDLATNTGTDVNHDGKTWKFTLKDGLKFQDGSPITSADVAYGVARSFSPDISDGPHYFQQWLTGSSSYNDTYKGPYNGGAAIPPGVETPDAKTIIFHFKQSQPDTPFAAAMSTTAAISKAHDTGPAAMDQQPFASGPYMITSHLRDNKITLARNPNWDPRTDAVRHDYPDSITVEIGPDDKAQANRLIADHGEDQDGLALDTVPTQMVPQVTGNAAVKSRTLYGATSYVFALTINTTRVKDLKVRQALNYAMDKAGFLQAEGGYTAGEVTGNIMSPTVAGYAKNNSYPSKGDHGDVGKAKQLLGGKHPELHYAFKNSASGQENATVVKSALEKAGFKIILTPVDSSSYYSSLGKKDNPYDLYYNSWSADWPNGSTVIGQEFDGTTIQPSGNNDTSYLNVAEVNNKIKDLEKKNVKDAAPGWAALDKEIMSKYAPMVPLYFTRSMTLTGSKVHGAQLSSVISNPVYYNVYLSK